MSDILLKIGDVAKNLGIAETTVKKYAQTIESYGYKFDRSIQNAFLFSKNDVDMFKIIVSLRKQNYKVDEAVKQAMSDMAVDVTDVSTDVSDSVDMADILKVVSDMSKNMIDMSKKIESLEQQNKELIEHQNRTQLLLEAGKDDDVDKRDKLLMETLAEMREVKQMIAASKEEEKPKSGWKFWKKK